MRLLRFVQYKSRIDPDTGVVEGGALHTLVKALRLVVSRHPTRREWPRREKARARATR